MASATDSKEPTGPSKKAPLMKTFEIYRWVSCMHCYIRRVTDIYHFKVS